MMATLLDDPDSPLLQARSGYAAVHLARSRDGRKLGQSGTAGFSSIDWESSHCVAYDTRLKADGAPQRHCTSNSITQSCRCSHQATTMLKTVNQLQVSISIVLVKLASGPL